LEYKPAEVSKLESANPLVGLGIPTRHIGDTFRHDFEGSGTIQESKWWYASLIEVLVHEVDKYNYLCPAHIIRQANLKSNVKLSVNTQ
jgi:hypothetical protein